MAPDEIDDLEIKSLHAALAAENDPKRFEALLNQLDRVIDNRVKRARAVPDTEHR